MPVVTPGKPGHPWHQTLHQLGFYSTGALVTVFHGLCVHCTAQCVQKMWDQKLLRMDHVGEPFAQFGVKCAVSNMKCVLRSVICALYCAKCAKCAKCVKCAKCAVLAPVCWAGRRPGDPSHAARSTPLCHHHYNCHPHHNHYQYHPGDSSFGFGPVTLFQILVVTTKVLVL